MNASESESIREILFELERLKVDTTRGNPEGRSRAVEQCCKLLPSPYSEVNLQVTAFLEQIFLDFKTQQNTIINAAYDMAEDTRPDGRHEGISFIVALTKRAPTTWARRNVDVLVQLLALDDQEDIDRLFSALSEHIKVDPTSTLSVLCSFLDRGSENSTVASTPELRAQIIAYLTTHKAKDEYLNNMNSITAIEYRNSLMQLLPRSSTNELTSIVNNLIAPYPHPETFTHQIIEALLEKSRAVLAAYLSDPSSFNLNDVFDIAESAYNVYSRIGRPIEERFLLLAFHSDPAILDSRSKLPPPKRPLHVQRLAEFLDIPEYALRNLKDERYVDCRNRVASDIKAWSHTLLTANGPKLWEFAPTLLQTVLRRLEDDTTWKPDADQLQRLSDRLDSPNFPPATLLHVRKAQSIIAAIVKLTTEPIPVAPPPTVPQSAPIQVDHPIRAVEKRKAEEATHASMAGAPTHTISAPSSNGTTTRSTLPTAPRNGKQAAPTRPQTLIARLSGPGPSTKPSGEQQTNGTRGKVEPNGVADRPAKRVKRATDDAHAPSAVPTGTQSLLARMGGSGSSSSTIITSTTPSIPTPIQSLPVRSTIASRLAPKVPTQLSLTLTPNGVVSGQPPPKQNPSMPAPSIAPKQTVRQPAQSSASGSLSILGAASSATNRPNPQSALPNIRTTASSFSVQTPSIAPKSGGLSIKGAASGSSSPAAFTFQKAIANIGKASTPTPPGPRNPTDNERPKPELRRTKSLLLSRLSDPATPARQSLSDRMQIDNPAEMRNGRRSAR